MVIWIFIWFVTLFSVVVACGSCFATVVLVVIIGGWRHVVIVSIIVLATIFCPIKCV